MEKGHPSIAKITRPSLPAASPRERLFRRLDAGTQYRAAWISGPAGSGKTTLVSSWLESRALSCLWYQMDGGDADMSTFFYYLGQAARQAAPRRQKPLFLLTPEYLADVPAFSRRYFEDLWGRLRPPFIVVIDNYHELPQGSPFDETLRAGLAAVPEGFRVLILSRSEPPPAFTGMLAGSRLDLVGWDDLRLTEDESAVIARQHLGDGQSEETLRWMHEKTGGWAAGLILLAKLVTRGDIDPRSSAGDGSEQVYDYFANELFDKGTDEATRNFLLKTSFLPRITPSVAEQLTGNREAGRILFELNRRNYFTEKRLGPELSYQYHPLFREFLHARAAAAFDLAERTRLQTAAAALLEQSGQIEDAAELYRAAGDETKLARLILSHAQTLVGQGRHRTLEQWLLGLSPEIRSVSPWLLYWLGICRLPFNPPEARSHFENAFTLFDRSEAAAGMFLSWSGAVDTFIYEWGDVRPLGRWIDVMQGLLTRYPAILSGDIGTRVVISMFCALMYRRPAHPDLPAWEARARDIAFNSPDIPTRVMVGHHLLFYHAWWSGDQGKASQLVDMLRQSVENKRATPLALIGWYAIEATYQWKMPASQEACLAAVKKGLEIAESSGIHMFDTLLYAQGAWGALTFGDLDLGREFLHKMQATLNPLRHADICQYHMQAFMEASLRGDRALAAEHAESSFAAGQATGAPFGIAVVHVVMGLARYAQGARKLAFTHLATASEMAEDMRSDLVKFAAYRAYAEIELMDQVGGTERPALRRLMKLGAEHGYLNETFWNSEVMSRLCAAALERDIEPDYVRTLIRKRNLSPPIEKGGGRGEWIGHWPWPLKIFTFGNFVVQRNGAQLAYARKAPKKPLELLRLLVALGNNAGEARLMEMLWPDADGDKAHKALNVAVVRLRELLGLKEALHMSEGAVSLDERYVWTDARAFEKLVQEAEQELRDEKLPLPSGERAEVRGKSAIRNSSTTIVQHLEKAVALYRGTFLEGAAQSWAIGPRERFRDAFLRAVGALGALWEREQKWRRAVEVYGRGLAVDDLMETFYARTMVCLLRLGSQAEALAVYRRLRKTLNAYGLKPSDETEEMYRRIVSGGPAAGSAA